MGDKGIVGMAISEVLDVTETISYFIIYTQGDGSVEQVARQVSDYWTAYRRKPSATIPRTGGMFPTNSESPRYIPNHDNPDKTDLGVRAAGISANNNSFHITGIGMSREELDKFREYLTPRILA